MLKPVISFLIWLFAKIVGANLQQFSGLKVFNKIHNSTKLISGNNLRPFAFHYWFSAVYLPLVKLVIFDCCSKKWLNWSKKRFLKFSKKSFTCLKRLFQLILLFNKISLINWYKDTYIILTIIQKLLIYWPPTVFFLDFGSHICSEAVLNKAAFCIPGQCNWR